MTVGRPGVTIFPESLDYSKQLEYQLKKLEDHSKQRSKADNFGEG